MYSKHRYISDTLRPDSAKYKAQQWGSQNHQAAKLPYKSAFYNTQSWIHVVQHDR